MLLSLLCYSEPDFNSSPTMRTSILFWLFLSSLYLILTGLTFDPLCVFKMSFIFSQMRIKYWFIIFGYPCVDIIMNLFCHLLKLQHWQVIDLGFMLPSRTSILVFKQGVNFREQCCNVYLSHYDVNFNDHTNRIVGAVAQWVEQVD